MKTILLSTFILLTSALQAQETLMKADKFALEEKFDKAQELYQNCLNEEEDELLFENCKLHKARALFKAKNWSAAQEAYESISKNSYLWPLTLVEKAWINYKLEDYNRTLGLLATYKSPLLESYFIPEVEVLSALAYFKLCLWDDSFTIIQDFEEHEKNAKELKKWLQAKAYQNLDLDTLKNNPSVPYGRVLWLSLLHRPWINTVEKKREALKILGETLVSDIEAASQDLFNISLELYTKKKTLIYKKERLISNRYRGDLSHVQRKVTQYFWDFRGEFFADELGDYSFGLKSNCQTVSKGVGYGN